MVRTVFVDVVADDCASGIDPLTNSALTGSRAGARIVEGGNPAASLANETMSHKAAVYPLS